MLGPSSFPITQSQRTFSPSPGTVLLRLYIPTLCISILGRPFNFLVVWFPLTPLHFHHFRAPSLPRRLTHARFWTPPFDASCQRWDLTSVADSAINTWLKGTNPAFGPDCEDSPCYGIRNMNVLDVMRLFGECGFEFLPRQFDFGLT